MNNATTTSTLIQRPDMQRYSKITANRPYDYIYDKNYLVSTQIDHMQQTFKARSGTSNLVIEILLLIFFN